MRGKRGRKQSSTKPLAEKETLEEKKKIGLKNEEISERISKSGFGVGVASKKIKKPIPKKKNKDFNSSPAISFQKSKAVRSTVNEASKNASLEKTQKTLQKRRLVSGKQSEILRSFNIENISNKENITQASPSQTHRLEIQGSSSTFSSSSPAGSQISKNQTNSTPFSFSRSPAEPANDLVNVGIKAEYNDLKVEYPSQNPEQSSQGIKLECIEENISFSASPNENLDIISEQIHRKAETSANISNELFDRREERATSSEHQTVKLDSLIQIDNMYDFDVNYIERNMRDGFLDEKYRIILINWMIEVSEDLLLKRDTVYTAIYFVDTFLSRNPRLPRNELQLLGVTTLQLSAKKEEIYPPKLREFALTTNNSYTTKEIRDMELKILQDSNWLLNPLTLNFWLCFCTKKWDEFIDEAEEPHFGGLLNRNYFKDNEIYFRQDTSNSFRRFREISTLIDTAMLDSETLQYKPVTLIPAFIYLYLGVTIRKFEVDNVIANFRTSSSYIFPDEAGFQQLFEKFTILTFNVTMNDLLPALQFCSEFFSMPVKYDIPRAVLNPRSDRMTFEEILSYQMFNPDMISFVRRKKASRFQRFN